MFATDTWHTRFSLSLEHRPKGIFLFSPADFGVSAKNTKTLQRRDSFIGTPYWWASKKKIIGYKHQFLICTVLLNCFCSLFSLSFWNFSIHPNTGWHQKWWCVRLRRTGRMTTRQISGPSVSLWLRWPRSSHQIMRWTPWECCWKSPRLTHPLLCSPPNGETKWETVGISHKYYNI